MRQPTLLLTAFLSICTAAPLAAQAGGSVSGKDGRGYIGPTDTVPDEETPTAPPTSPPTPRTIPWTHPWIPPTAPPTSPPPETFRSPQPYRVVADPGDWQSWWRFQRWLALESTSLPLANPLTTPGAGSHPLPTLKAHPLGNAIGKGLEERWASADDKPLVRSEILIALARSSDSPSVSSLLRNALKDEDFRVAEGAAVAMGILGKPHGIPTLSLLLEGKGKGLQSVYSKSEAPERLQAFAAYGLGLIAEKTRYPGLRDTIAAPLLRGLKRGAFSSDEPAVACAAALGLFPFEDSPELLPPLLQCIQNKRNPATVRAMSVLSCAKILGVGNYSAISQSTATSFRKRLLSSSEKSEVRQACALALGRIGKFPTLIQISSSGLLEARKTDSDPRVRNLAAIALGELAASPSPVAQTAILPSLLEDLKNGTDRDRAWAAISLAWAHLHSIEASRLLPQTVPKRLLQYLDSDPNQSSQAAAALALGFMEFQPALPSLQAASLSQGSTILRAETLAALSLLAPSTAQDNHLEALDSLEPGTEAFQVACASLGAKNPQQLHSYLSSLLAKDSAQFQSRFAAALALGWIQGPLAIPTLEGLLEEDVPQDTIHAAAIRSLGRIGEGSQRRWNASYLDLLNPFWAPPTLLGSPSLPGICERI
ncbi:MAG: HEAT repeat domain-containing protein [Planctomycetota bacterium]|nr:HEAT repeat domain-containing protein [Planctomycetota bacterium]